ncbi:MAG: hypothetical protein LBR90_04415 [Elusimicrobiota bacterium]|jgi:hypothetical protein|nr:hypothetical protein [Elusimicrobiota bacterium]
MKNLKSATAVVAFAAVIAFCGCATAGGGATASAMPKITLEEALQKSADARAKLQSAQNAYNIAQAANFAAQNSATSQSAKQSALRMLDEAKLKLETTKQSIIDEANAWKDIVK